MSGILQQTCNKCGEEALSLYLIDRFGRDGAGEYCYDGDPHIFNVYKEAEPSTFESQLSEYQRRLLTTMGFKEAGT